MSISMRDHAVEEIVAYIKYQMDHPDPEREAAEVRELEQRIADYEHEFGLTRSGGHPRNPHGWPSLDRYLTIHEESLRRLEADAIVQNDLNTLEGRPDPFHKHVWNHTTWQEILPPQWIGRDHWPTLAQVVEEDWDWWQVIGQYLGD